MSYEEDIEARAMALLEAEEDFQELMGLDVAEILRIGQKAQFARLVSKVRRGEASHQEQAILRNILKDNGMILGIPPEDPAEAALLKHSSAPLLLPQLDEVPEWETSK